MGRLLQRVLLGVATVGPCGLAPVAPGTVGSLAGLALMWVVRMPGEATLEVVTLLVVTVVGVEAASVAESVYRRRDPGQVVIDEVAGMLMTVLFVPVGRGGALVAFLIFRLCDIVKPFPARQAEKLPRGWGIMADDLVAGLYGQGLLRVILWAARAM